MKKFIKNLCQSIGLVKQAQPGNNLSYKPADYKLANDEQKSLVHLNYLYTLEADENNRLTLLESKTSQLISQTGIIFSLLSLFVPLLIDKVGDVSPIIKILLLILLLFAFSAYMLTIKNALKNFKVTDFNYCKPSAKNVITFQDKPPSKFYNEVIQDLLYGLNENNQINNKKATNLLHSFNAFKLANSFMAILVGVFCMSILFFKPKESTMSIAGTVKVEHLDSALAVISGAIINYNGINKASSTKYTFTKRNKVDSLKPVSQKIKAVNQ